MNEKWTELGDLPATDDPGYEAWIDAFNAEADAWLSDCKKQDEDDKTKAFLALVSKVSEAYQDHYDVGGSTTAFIGPLEKKAACEYLVRDLWFVIDRLRQSDLVYDIAWYKRLADHYYCALSNFTDVVPQLYYPLIAEEIQEAFGIAYKTLNG